MMESRDCENDFFECTYCSCTYDTHTIVPYIVECGHSFCKVCLDKWNRECGLCKEVIADPQPNKTVIAILMRLEQIQADLKAVAVAVDRMIPENIKPKKEGFEEPTNSGYNNEETMFVCQTLCQKCEFSRNPCVFVNGIPTNWTDRDVVSYFQKGSYVENRGMVMIEFSSPEEADQAIRGANEQEVEKRKITVKQWVKRQNPYPPEAYHQLFMARMTHKRKQ